MAYVPRLSRDGMEGSRYWYSNTNPFVPANYGLPNCTCYAWGRYWECSPDNIPSNLPTGSGGNWFNTAVESGLPTGGSPKLGAVICFEDTSGGAGHVAVVEEIRENGDIVTSNSGYTRDSNLMDRYYFWTKVVTKASNYSYGKYRKQGFIYNPNIEVEIEPTPRTSSRK